MSETQPKKSSNTWIIVLLAVGGMCFIAVPVIGILAAIALPQFLNYVKRSKTSEATTQIRVIYTHIESQYAETGALPESIPWTPHEPPSSRKYTPSTEHWSGEWQNMGYRINDPHFYRYRFVKLGENRGRVEAEGDLDDDGKRSLFTMEVGVNEFGELTRAPAFDIQNELE